MIIYVNDRNEIKSVNTTDDRTLTPYELVEDNPFIGWSVAKICCYKVSVMPEVITTVIGTKEETYIDLKGNEQTRTVDVTKSEETGKYIVTMMTPYVDSRLLFSIDMLGKNTEVNANDITDSQESISELMEMSDANSSDITDCQEAISELMEIIEGGAE